MTVLSKSDLPNDIPTVNSHFTSSNSSTSTQSSIMCIFYFKLNSVQWWSKTFGVKYIVTLNFGNAGFHSHVLFSLITATCTEFLKRQGRELGAKVHVMECAPGKPIVIVTVDGQDPTLPSLLLNSHTDVVPVFPVGFALHLLRCIVKSGLCLSWSF